MMRENIRCTMIIAITFAASLPIVAMVNYFARLGLPVLRLSLLVSGVFLLFPWLLIGLLFVMNVLCRRASAPQQDLYRLTTEGLYFPVYRNADPPYVRWDEVVWWELRNDKRLPAYRIIAIKTQRPIRKIWLSGGQLDEQILLAFQAHAPPRNNR